GAHRGLDLVHGGGGLVGGVDGLLVGVSGHPLTPARSAGHCAICSGADQGVVVWKDGGGWSSVEESISPGGVCAVSRRMSRPSDFRTARWPPLRSAGVRRHSSAA